MLEDQRKLIEELQLKLDDQQEENRLLRKELEEVKGNKND
jgi:hypothetical protein